MSQRTSGGLRLRVSVSGQIVQLEVEQSAVVGGLRVVLLDYGEDFEGEPAGERKGELIKRGQAGQEMRRHEGVAKQKQRVVVRVVLVVKEVSVQQGSLTLSVWCGAAPVGGVDHSCVALLRRRLGHVASDQPSERQTRWDQKLHRAAQTVRRTGQRVSVRSLIGTPHDRGVGNVLTEEGRKVWAVVCGFGVVSGLRAVGASLLGVRGTDRDVKGGVGGAQCRGEDIRGPQVSARDEPRDLRLGRAVAGLSRCVYQRGDRVVPARSFAHRAAGGVGRARVQGSGLASSTKHWFIKPSAAQAQADRVNVLLALHHCTMMRVYAPHIHV